MSDSDLVMGFYPKQPSEKAPDFVIGKVSVKIADFKTWLYEFEAANPDEEWLNIDLKVSKQGKGYAVVDHWKPEKSPPATKSEDEVGRFPDDSDIPF
jgi:hypothetical protein